MLQFCVKLHKNTLQNDTNTNLHKMTKRTHFLDNSNIYTKLRKMTKRTHFYINHIQGDGKL